MVTEPFRIQRVELGDGLIIYEIYDSRPSSYRYVCSVSEAEHDGRMISAKHEAEFIVRALNEHVGHGLYDPRRSFEA